MGRDKAGLSLGGKTLLEHVLERAKGWGGKRIMVAGPVRPWVAAEYIPDHTQHRPSSLRGFYGGLLAAGSPWVLVTGCDMPFVKKEVVSHLWREKNAGGAVAWWHNRLQPLPGFYPRLGAKAVAALLAGGSLHLTSLLDCLQSARIRDITTVDPEGLSFFNINTPDDLSLAEKRLEESPSVAEL